jgi:predicted SnoaL-like aldol condensation-catalyzing enzyme
LAADFVFGTRFQSERVDQEKAQYFERVANEIGETILALYELMISQKKSEEGTAKFRQSGLHPAQPAHLRRFRSAGAVFSKVTRERVGARVVVHRIIAVGEYVWAHVNFMNLFNDDPQDTGIAGVDIYKMDSDGKAIEHWDVLQLVGNPKDSAPLIAPNIPRANPNGMF